MDEPAIKKAKPYDSIAYVMRQKLDGLPGISEKAMMGGLCFMMDGHMIGGVDKAGYMFRVGKEREAEALSVPGAAMKKMGANGRTMSGFLEADRDAGDATLDPLLGLALSFVSTLPPKI